MLTATLYLTLGFALILSALSLPGDIKERTFFTVVTKPVRKTEVVFGRILGFTAVGTLMLIAMGVISYFFTVRGLSHTHTLTAAQLHEQAMPGGQPPLLKGLTGQSHGHQHELIIDPLSGRVTIEPKQGHTHELRVWDSEHNTWHAVGTEDDPLLHKLLSPGSSEKPVYALGPPQGMLIARVPIYGKLRFRDRAGKEAEKGVNVGDEWTYRSFVAGGTRAAAIWTFEGIVPERFPTAQYPNEIPLEMTIEVFRTHKGDVEKPILGNLWLQNPKTGRKVEVRNFLAKKFATDVQMIPRTLEVVEEGKTEKLDLFRDVVADDGRLIVGVKCLEGGQFFGMAQPDVYFRTHDAPFVANFIKGYTGIWLQMVVVLTLGVMFSTFLSAPVALIATIGAVAVGLFSGYMSDLATGQVLGGGPFESFVRLVTQQNVISELEPGLQTNVAQMSDRVMQGSLWVLSSLLPPFDRFDFADYVAYGFDVSPTTFSKCLLQAAALLLPMALAGFFFLKMREVAK